MLLRSRDWAGSIAAPIAFFLACGFVYLGVRGFQARGITLWLRTGGVQHIRGTAGRIVGAIFIAVGCALLGISVRLAQVP